MEPNIISITSINAGENRVFNVIPDICTISGTIRATNMEVIKQIQEEMRSTVLNITKLHKAKCEMEIKASVEPVENEKELINLSYNTINKVFNSNCCDILEKGSLGGENFSEFSRRVPSCYLYIGNETEENRNKFELHSALFEIDENILLRGSIVLSSIIRDYLSQKN